MTVGHLLREHYRSQLTHLSPVVSSLFPFCSETVGEKLEQGNFLSELRLSSHLDLDTSPCWRGCSVNSGQLSFSIKDTLTLYSRTTHVITTHEYTMANLDQMDD